MKQHVVHDQVAVHYADGVDHVWQSWDPSLRRCEELLVRLELWQETLGDEELASELRRAQYRAHSAGEVANGLTPPPSAMDAHLMMLGSLAACRDTLGVLALRAEMGELDADMTEIGLHAVEATREAFNGARSSTALVHAWVAQDQVDPDWVVEQTSPTARAWPALLWLLVTSCAALFVLLLVQVFVIGAPA